MGHGHVTPNADGTKARCGGPGLCPQCSQEACVAYPMPTSVREPHSCIWCPVEVRDLAAVAHNAVVNYGTGREQQKMADLKAAVERYRPAMDAHFAALKNEDPAALRAEIERLTRERDDWKRRAGESSEYVRPEPTAMPGPPERRR